MIYSRIIGTGSYLPHNVVTNDDLAQRMDTSDEWINSRTGIRQRHIAQAGETSSSLALEASKAAIASAGIAAQDIDLIILATSTPDCIFPSTACLLQAKLGIKGCPAFDLQAACSALAMTPGLSSARRITAPAPTPNNTQVPRSFQSRMRENTSAPTTRAQRCWPERMNRSAVASA